MSLGPNAVPINVNVYGGDIYEGSQDGINGDLVAVLGALNLSPGQAEAHVWKINEQLGAHLVATWPGFDELDPKGVIGYASLTTEARVGSMPSHEREMGLIVPDDAEEGLVISAIMAQVLNVSGSHDVFYGHFPPRFVQPLGELGMKRLAPREVDTTDPRASGEPSPVDEGVFLYAVAPEIQAKLTPPPLRRSGFFHGGYLYTRR